MQQNSVEYFVTESIQVNSMFQRNRILAQELYYRFAQSITENTYLFAQNITENTYLFESSALIF